MHAAFPRPPRMPNTANGDALIVTPARQPYIHISTGVNANERRAKILITCTSCRSRSDCTGVKVWVWTGGVVGAVRMPFTPSVPCALMGSIKRGTKILGAQDVGPRVTR